MEKLQEMLQREMRRSAGLPSPYAPASIAQASPRPEVSRQPSPPPARRSLVERVKSLSGGAAPAAAANGAAPAATTRPDAPGQV